MIGSAISGRMRLLMYLVGFFIDAGIGAVVAGTTAAHVDLTPVAAGLVAGAASISAALKLLAAANVPADLILRRGLDSSAPARAPGDSSSSSSSTPAGSVAPPGFMTE